MNERLYRLRDDRFLAGVAGGVADHLGLDPSLVRIIWLLLVPLTGGMALLAYVVMAIVVPEEDPAAEIGVAPGSVPGSVPGSAPGTEFQPMTGRNWPDQRRAERAARRARRPNGSGAMILGAILIMAGAWLLLRQLVPALDPDRVWPLVLIGIGLLLLALAFGRHGKQSASGTR